MNDISDRKTRGSAGLVAYSASLHGHPPWRAAIQD